MTEPQSAAQTSQPDQATYAASATAAASAAGRFVWHDLMTTDPDASLAFYTQLFGWTTKQMDMGPAGMYTMWNAGGRDIGGMVPMDASAGHPPHWIAYATVPSVDAAVQRATALGGTSPFPGTDIPNVGRFAVIADPTGAHISPFTALPGQEAPEQSGPPAPGTFCWDELLTADPEVAGAFYKDIFGWTVETMPMGDYGTYYLFKRGDVPVGGMMKMPDDAASPPNWLSYVAVTSADETARRVVELGGNIYVQPTDIPNVGRFAVAADPTGTTFAFLQGTSG